jgi:hypothetical protein
MKLNLSLLLTLTILFFSCKEEKKDNRNLFLGVAALASQGSGQITATHKATARITDKATGAVIANATINFTHGSTRNVPVTSTVITDANGEFIFLMSGLRLVLKVLKPDNSPYTGEAIVVPNPEGGFPTVTYSDGSEFLVQWIGFAPIEETPNQDSGFTIGGTITGLVGSGFILNLNSNSDLTISSGSTSFTFPGTFEKDTSYDITIKQQPNLQICTVLNAKGTISSSVSNVKVECFNRYSISGTVTGLTASGLSLRLNSLGSTVSTLNIASGATSFTFPITIPAGNDYSVQVATQPSGQTCSISNASGIANANVTNVSVNCVTPPPPPPPTNHTIFLSTNFGTASQLSGMVVRVTSSITRTITPDVTFPYGVPIPNGTYYEIQVITQPDAFLECEPPNLNSGIIEGANVNITLNCLFL